MKTSVALCALLIPAAVSAAEIRLSERVALTLRDVPQAELPASRESLMKLSSNRVGKDIALPDGVQARVEWSSAAEYCSKINRFARFELHSWKTMMEAASVRTFSKDAGWVSTSNVERVGNSATLVVYRYGRKNETGKFDFRVIADVFGESTLGSITFSWVGLERDAAEAFVAAAVNSIRIAE